MPLVKQGTGVKVQIRDVCKDTMGERRTTDGGSVESIPAKVPFTSAVVFWAGAALKAKELRMSGN